MPTRLTGAPIVASALNRAEDARRSRHVELHLVHPRRLLERDSAGVEGDALADERDRRLVLLAAPVLEHDQPRRFVGAAGHRQERAHSETADLRYVEDANADAAVLARELLRGFREIGRRADVGRQVRKIARQRGAGHDAAPMLDSAARLGHVRVGHGNPEAREFRRRRLLRRLEVRDAVEHVRHAFDCVPRGVVRIEPGNRLGGQVRHRVGGTGLREPLCRREDRAPVGLAAVGGLWPEADEQHALGGTAACRDDRQRLRALAGKIAATQQLRDRPAAGAVELPRRRRHDRVLVDPDDRAGGFLARRSGLGRMKLHDSLSPEYPVRGRHRPLSALPRWFTVSASV